jgi:endonuclease/exonuclease/phosphatase family metal-dependent hydrolase
MSAKKKTTKKKASGTRATTSKPGAPSRRSDTATNGTAVFGGATGDDRISRLLDARKLVPREFAGSDQYLDVLCWNIRWFDHKDPERVRAVTEVLDALNGDVFVLTEVADDGALDEVVESLNRRKAGCYSAKVGPNGTRGGQQRVALLWDRDWVRSKREIGELFADARPKVADELKANATADVFPRLPVWGYYEARDENGAESFSFDLIGLHLKAQGPRPRSYKGTISRFGIPQRKRAARLLGDWVKASNGNVFMIGDWNATPDQPEWASLRTLERQKILDFTKINGTTVPSHLARLNQGGIAGTRIDLQLITNAGDARRVPGQVGVVIQWSAFQDLATMTAAERSAVFKAVKQTYSDHLPVVSRFYLARG